MTEKEINKKVRDKELKYCPHCDTDLDVSNFYIKKPPNPKHWRFNSPCRKCSNIARQDVEGKRYQREYQLKNKYGIGIKEYNDMLENQNGVCKICNGVDVKNLLAVDHCHSTGKIRGILCGDCNTGLGRFKDDVDLLNKAIEYIIESKTKW
jgi:hypothetical protein